MDAPRFVVDVMLGRNTTLEPRAKDSVRSVVPSRVVASHTSFMGCPSCGRIFWAGTHFRRMWQKLERLVRGPDDRRA